jgi:hypothetical protein
MLHNLPVITQGRALIPVSGVTILLVSYEASLVAPDTGIRALPCLITGKL